MMIGEICTRDVVMIAKDAAVVEAACLMRQHHVGAVLVTVVREGLAVPVGILTDRDLVVEVLARDVDPQTVTVGDIMSAELLTAGAADSLWDTLQRMRQYGARRVPVVDAGGGLQGIVTMDDVLELLAEELNVLARLISHERHREEAQRP